MADLVPERLSILSELHQSLEKLRRLFRDFVHFQFFLSCIWPGTGSRSSPITSCASSLSILSELHRYGALQYRGARIRLSILSELHRTAKVLRGEGVQAVFQFFLSCIRIFLLVGVYMFNVYFYQEVCKTVLALKFTRWKLLKLPNWESSRNSLFWVGNFSRNLFLK